MIDNSTVTFRNRYEDASGTASPDELLARVLDDYLSALESGAPLDVDRLAAQYPQMGADIRAFAESLDVLHHATRKFRGDKLDSAAAPAAARRLGDFEIGAEIGRGGMGVVYEARQISLDRKVALKVLPFAAVWDQKQIARFRNEAHAAAQLHHPNIVPVFAVGEERGVHFYAMQYIAGQSLEGAIRELRQRVDGDSQSVLHNDETRLAATTERAPRLRSAISHQYSENRSAYFRAVARLGVQAAEALQHAHDYGVVHRDVKPSNLLLDCQGKLWITDFGLARVQSNPGVTVTGDVVGTLRYMSPEQAAGEHGLVDARADIYGLGTTLYELVTLRPAFPGDDRRQVLRAIESQEPAVPRSLNPEIPLDLETIILQAMSKTPAARYGTARAFAEDLNRFLEGLPTQARRPTIVDRTTKWLRRHRALAAAAAIATVLLAAVSSVSAILLVRERAEKTAALAQSDRNLVQAQQVVDRFGIQLADQLQNTPGTERVRQQLLLETLNYYRGFVDQAGTEGELEDQLAMTHLKAGVVTAKLGATGKAIDEYRTAQNVLGKLLEKDPDDSKLQSHLALSRNNLALLLVEQGDTKAAMAEYDAAIAVQQQLVAEHPREQSYANQLAESHINRGTLFGQLGQTAAAVQSLRRAVRILDDISAHVPETPQEARNLAIAFNNLSFVERQLNQGAAARSAQRAVNILEPFAAEEGASEECLADLALCYCNLAAIQSELGHDDQASHSYGRAIALRESLIRKSPGIVRHRSELAASLNNLALLELRSGDVAAAAAAFRRANQLFAALLADYPEQIAYASGWAALLNNQALALARISRHDDAIKAYQQAATVQEKVIAELNYTPAVREALSRIYFNYGQSLQTLEQYTDAVAIATKRRQLWRGNGERLFGVAVEFAQLADKSAEARPAALEALREAVAAGYQPDKGLASDHRFASIAQEPDFQAIIHGAKELR